MTADHAGQTGGPAVRLPRVPLFAMTAVVPTIGHAVASALLLAEAENELQAVVPPHLFERALGEAARRRDDAVHGGWSALDVTLDAYREVRDGYVTGELS